MTLKVVERPRQALNISVYEGDEQLVASATHEPSPNDPD